MLCPNCKKELIVVERDSIELDYCPFCKGFWFDNREWDLLCRRLELREGRPIRDLYSIPKVRTREGLKNCPICSKKMEKFLSYGVILDRCPQKHGVWFDEGEISRLLNRSETSEEAPVKFLGEVFYR